MEKDDKTQAIRTPMQLAMILQGYRKQRRFSQKQAGEHVGLLPKTISALESRPERSCIESLFKLISALDLEMVLLSKEKGRTAKGEW
ncbi:MAG: XRE family transcriptional regulator [Chlorobium sp.]|nr:MAG: XRE family transcriptional regulator [Chlorobium sp.]